MTGICDSCNMTFLSRNENSEQAEQQIKAKFDAHICKLVNSSLNSPWIVEETPENK